MTIEDLISQWGEYPVTVYTLYLALPRVKYPPSFLSMTFGDDRLENIKAKELNLEFQVYEDQHPNLKGTMTTWKVLRVEVYPGTKDCAYKAMVICHCDRL